MNLIKTAGVLLFAWSATAVTDKETERNNGQILHEMITRFDHPRSGSHRSRDEQALAMVQRAVEGNADVNAIRNGRTPVGLAAIRFYPRTVEFLINNEADVNIDKLTLHRALNAVPEPIQREQVRFILPVVFSLAEKADLTVRDRLNRLPLHLAFENNFPDEFIVTLLENGGGEDLTEQEKEHLLAFAVRKNKPKAAGRLIQVSAKPNPPAPGSVLMEWFAKVAEACLPFFSPRRIREKDGF